MSDRYTGENCTLGGARAGWGADGCCRRERDGFWASRAVGCHRSAEGAMEVGVVPHPKAIAPAVDDVTELDEPVDQCVFSLMARTPGAA